MIRLKANFVFTRCYRVEKVVRVEKVIESTEDRWFLIRVPSKLFLNLDAYLARYQ